MDELLSRLSERPSDPKVLRVEDRDAGMNEEGGGCGRSRAS